MLDERSAIKNPAEQKAVARRTRVTSFDVAAEAGVSQSTVSRALAGDPVVSEATRERVLEAARKLHYHVDENAARLRTGRTGTLAVAVIVRQGEHIQDHNPFYYALLGAICAAASRRGYETLVSFQNTAETLFGHYQEQRKADGLVVLGASDNREAWEYFREIGQGGANMVCWGSPYSDLEWVRSDNIAGAALATRHLRERGYARIACVTSVGESKPEFRERYEGCVATLAEEGLAPILAEIEPGLPREEQGRRAVAELIASGKAFDAVFAACDEIALGVLHALAEHGIAVPGEVGVIGFDGIRAAALANPPLSTIAADFEAAGAMLVDRILAIVNGGQSEQRRVPVRLRERPSSAGSRR